MALATKVAREVILLRALRGPRRGPEVDPRLAAMTPNATLRVSPARSGLVVVDLDGSDPSWGRFYADRDMVVPGDREYAYAISRHFPDGMWDGDEQELAEATADVIRAYVDPDDPRVATFTCAMNRDRDRARDFQHFVDELG